MTDAYFGRAVPIHFAILALAGWRFDDADSYVPSDDGERLEEMRRGHVELVRATKVDFGYDLAAWRELLLNFEEFGYRHPYAFRGVDEAVQEAIGDPAFQRLRSFEEARLRPGDSAAG